MVLSQIPILSKKKFSGIRMRLISNFVCTQIRANKIRISWKFLDLRWYSTDSITAIIAVKTYKRMIERGAAWIIAWIISFGSMDLYRVRALILPYLCSIPQYLYSYLPTNLFLYCTCFCIISISFTPHSITGWGLFLAFVAPLGGKTWNFPQYLNWQCALIRGAVIMSVQWKKINKQFVNYE